MENNPQKLLNNNTQEAVELLGLSSSDSLDSPSFSHFQAPKQKRKVRFKKPFRPGSRLKSGRNTSQKNCKCSFMEGFKIFSYFTVLAIVGALLWYVMTLSTRIQELQAKFADLESKISRIKCHPFLSNLAIASSGKLLHLIKYSWTNFPFFASER
ncbi:uncharacterized protein TNCT_579951 [Trichonephila clavata]|uniref:Uncharacterized protein n=1 Tax=Trichonephila clavata TaxID=2740835 RepID=A0A8X6JCL8_TRICU|nr:uncharacterized protein TNCT_579951 [Trichonephila clavata]